MPIIDENLVQHNLQGSAYNYSAAKIEDLGASEYTLVCIVSDVSSSVTDYKQEMENCLKEIIKSCKFSPRADNLMVRHVQFASKQNETHGYRPLENCHLNDYDGVLNIGGMTSLY
ncbi:MAG: hypothetical protein CUN55_20580, partial [Phototrophicales bacterium]